MQSKTKIVVLHMKELIYTGIFLLFALLLILILILMFGRGKDQKPSVPSISSSSIDGEKHFTPGIYTSTITLNGAVVDVEVSVDEDHINAIRLVHLDDVITTMYPLIEPTFDELVSQIYEKQSLDGISYSADNHYTSMLILDAIENALNKSIDQQFSQ